MKTLLLVRHAKSSWANPGQNDHDRPLNDRGKQDAPEMARRLKEKEVHIDRLVSSTAKRARKTAKLFAEELGYDKKEIVLVEKLYGALPEAFDEVVAHLDNKDNVVALFSHNPGITEFANTLTQVHIDNMPTCSVFAVSSNADSWAQFREGERSFLFFDYPKNPMP